MSDAGLSKVEYGLVPYVASGRGVFRCGARSFEHEFELLRFGRGIRIDVKGVAAELLFGMPQTITELTGELTDGRAISCSELNPIRQVLAAPGDSFIQFSPYRFLDIGVLSSGSVKTASFPLVGHYSGKFAAAFDGWSIEARDRLTEPEAARHMIQSWGIAPEGYVMVVSGPPCSLEEYVRVAWGVMHLLSLANGTGVTYHRARVGWQSGGELERWGRGAGDEVGPGSVVPDWLIKPYLEQVIPVWFSWPQDKRDLVRLISQYINCSWSGYLDTRLMQIAQAWEVLSTAWTSAPGLSGEVEELKEAVIRRYREWRCKYPTLDEHGHWGDRLAKSFGWEKLIERVQKLAIGRDLDVSRIGLDLRALKDARDAVAHNGVLPKQLAGDSRRCVSILQGGQLGLQLLLLDELGYDGLVKFGENGWAKHEPIGNMVRHDHSAVAVDPIESQDEPER